MLWLTLFYTNSSVEKQPYDQRLGVAGTYKSYGTNHHVDVWQSWRWAFILLADAYYIMCIHIILKSQTSLFLITGVFSEINYVFLQISWTVRQGNFGSFITQTEVRYILFNISRCVNKLVFVINANFLFPKMNQFLQ